VLHEPGYPHPALLYEPRVFYTYGMDLPERIERYILASKQAVSYQEIMSAAEKKGFSKVDVIGALSKVHKKRSIRVASRLGTIYYDPAPVHTVMAAPRIPDHKYPVMDETNDAHHEIFDGMDFSDVFKTPEELKFDKFKREREITKILQ